MQEIPTTGDNANPERTLLAHHRLTLEQGSGIHPDVIAQRGYWSAQRWQDLDGLRFSGFQKRPECFPALMIPQHDPSGELICHVLRYDTPRSTREGKVIKYEQPKGMGLRLDVPLRCLPGLRDPSQTLWFTEGAKKADCLASQSENLVAVNTPGVDGWRSPSAIPDLFGIPFKERQGRDIVPRSVVLAYDSDVMSKQSVRFALISLANWTKQRGAEVSVLDWKRADVPEGSKTGVDDFLTTHTLDDLHELLIPFAEWLEGTKPKEGSPGCPYRATPAGLEWLKPDKFGNVGPTLLANFAAKITADVAEDDGAEVRRVFEIQSYLKERTKTFRVVADKFTAMNWVTEHMGASAILYPGTGTKDHARAAIQLLSGEVPERVVFTHLGWRKIEDRWFYLHAGGAIGAEGAVDGVDVAVTGALGGYELPEPPSGEELVACIRASLEILGVAPKGVTVPLLAAPYRAVIGGVDHSIHLAGPTGAGKSVLAALVQQHFGPSMDGRNLPAGWSSTGNALELLAFLAKDAILTVDDFVPSGGAADVAKLNRDAERLFRGQGNQAGRQRLTADATLRAGKPPRGLVLSTGEDVPRGQSLRARLLILEVEPSDINWAQVGRCQKMASEGTYARTLAAFIKWLAPKYGYLHSTLPQRIAGLRSAAYKSNLHRRVPEIVANLSIGLATFLDFAYQAGAWSLEECAQHWASWWAALNEPAARQAKHQAATEPARRFLTLLGAALSSGQAHLSGEDGEHPVNPDAWGWRRHSSTVAGYTVDEWHPQGPRVGWIDGDDVYLDPEAAYGAAQGLGARTGEPLIVTSQTLRKRLKEQGFLASMETTQETITVRRVHAGQMRRVLHLSLSTLYGAESPVIPVIVEAAAAPLWVPTGEAPKMTGIAQAMTGQMSGFGRASTGTNCKENEAELDQTVCDSLSLETNEGNDGNDGSSLGTPRPKSDSEASVPFPLTGEPNNRDEIPVISPAQKPDIGQPGPVVLPPAPSTTDGEEEWK